MTRVSASGFICSRVARYLCTEFAAGYIPARAEDVVEITIEDMRCAEMRAF